MSPVLLLAFLVMIMVFYFLLFSLTVCLLRDHSFFLLFLVAYHHRTMAPWGYVTPSIFALPTPIMIKWSIFKLEVSCFVCMVNFDSDEKE